MIDIHHHYHTLLQALPLLTALLTSSRTKCTNFVSHSPVIPLLLHYAHPPVQPKLPICLLSSFFFFSLRHFFFKPASESEISNILINWPNKQSDSESMCLCPYSYHHQHCQTVSHLWYRLSNYRPVCKTIIYKIIERVVKCRLTKISPSFHWSSQSSSACLPQTSLHWSSPTVYPRSPVECHRIIEDDSISFCSRNCSSCSVDSWTNNY